MRIGVVTTSYPRWPGDHAGNFVAAQVDALRELGHDVEVISAASSIAPDTHARLFAGAGAPDALERGDLRTYLAAARFSIAQIRAVAAALPHWDLVIAHWIAPSALAVAFASLARHVTRSAAIASLARHVTRSSPQHERRGPAVAPHPRLVVVAHGGDVHTLRRLRLLAPALRVLRAVDARLVFVSNELRDIARASAPSLRAWLDAASIVQPMGIDLARFTAIRARRHRRTGTHQAAEQAVPLVLVVARLVPVKGVDVAIRALSHLRTRVRLVIAGDGPERARLEALARGVAGVELVGAVDANVRDTWLREAACVVVPSRVLPNGRSEGTPMIAIEAMAAGVPVIASDVGGLSDLPGLVRVRPDDPRALAAAIDRVLDSARKTGGPAPASDDADELDAVGATFEPRTTAHDLEALRAMFDHRQSAARVVGLWADIPSDCEAGDSTSRRTA